MLRLVILESLAIQLRMPQVFNLQLQNTDKKVIKGQILLQLMSSFYKINIVEQNQHIQGSLVLEMAYHNLLKL